MKENLNFFLNKKLKYFLLLIVCTFCGTIVTFQHKTQDDEHERLINIGISVLITAKLNRISGVNYANYFFTTIKGEKIVANQKCGNEFYKYKHAVAIYNPENPQEYELSFDFYNFDRRWRFVFFYLIYLPGMIFVTFNAVRGIFLIYYSIKNR